MTFQGNSDDDHHYQPSAGSNDREGMRKNGRSEGGEGQPVYRFITLKVRENVKGQGVSDGGQKTVTPSVFTPASVTALRPMYASSLDTFEKCRSMW